ncbi:hypothetical protein ACLMJK_004785 [Lecanora helva]
MPYTPPARSPAASRPDTPPSLSPSQSHKKNESQDHGDRCQNLQSGLHHSSSSYLSKRRRSPSITQLSSCLDSSTSYATHHDKAGKDNDGGGKSLSVGTTDQNKPQSEESTDSSTSVSPPSSGDEEKSEKRGRKRNVTKLAELQAAIKIIEQHRSGSPTEEECEETKQARIALGLPGPRLGATKLNNVSSSQMHPRLPLSPGARKISHSRSTTDASAFFDFPRNKIGSPAPSTSQSDDEDLDDDELEMKPGLIRKKSGELVRPALRASSLKRRPSSMPGTPTFSKAVHFQESSLEHVRHFLQVDRPIAVSAGSSPVDPHDSDSEFPLGSDDSSPSSPPYEWEIRLTNFPRPSIEREVLPVRTEKVYLSSDTKVLIGQVAVRNLAFHKLVVARFTLDFWKTTSEVMAEYNHEIRRSQGEDGCDRFTFNIKLEDQANLETKTMFFCIKYNVNGQDYWDNNNSTNYQVDFSKKFRSHNGKHGACDKENVDAPRRGRQLAPRPRSMPSFDDFANMVSPFEFSSFPQPSTIVGDSPIRFRNKAPAKDNVSDGLGKSKASANQAFGNRYDFGASLSAAIQAAGNSTLSPKENVKPTRPTAEEATAPTIKVQPAPGAGKPLTTTTETKSQNTRELPKPAALTAEKPPLSSSSYHELLDKYCFFGSGKSTPHPAKTTPPKVDSTSNSSPSSEPTSNRDSPSAGSTSPPSPRHDLSAVEEKQLSPKIASPCGSRSASPAIRPGVGSRTASPAFGYPYHQSMQGGMQGGFFDTHTPTAIRG